MGGQAGRTQHDLATCMAFYNVDGFNLPETKSFDMFLETQAERGLRPDRARTAPDRARTAPDNPGPRPMAPDRARTAPTPIAPQSQCA